MIITIIAYAVSLAAILVGAADIWTTNRILAAGGREKNPWMAWLQDKLNELWGLPKLAVHSAFSLLAIWHPHWGTAAVTGTFTAVIGYVVVKNLGVMRRQAARHG